jgi:hypothetical protein
MEAQPAVSVPAAPSAPANNRRRWLIIGAAISGVLLLCCCLAVTVPLFVARHTLPRAVRHGVSTEVARQLPATPGRGVAPGTYVITQQALQASLRGSTDSTSADRLIVRLTPAGMQVGLDSAGRGLTYTGVPTAANGLLVMRDMRIDSGLFGVLLSPSALGHAIEDAVNGYLADNGLQLTAVQLGNGSLTLTTATR